MKKTMVLAAAGVVLLSMAACSGNKNCKDTACSKSDDKVEVYTGVLPAADCEGIRYTLHLDYDDANDGDYKLVETYLEADSTSAIGYIDAQTFSSEGDFSINKKGGITYIKLDKDVKDSSTGSIDTPIYFVVNSDATITMSNSDLEVSTIPGLNYTLKLAK